MWILLVGALAVGLAFQRSLASTTFSVSEAVSMVDVRTDAGDIEVVVGDGPGVTAVRTATHWAGGRFDERAEGGVLVIRATCPSWSIVGCEANYRIEVPAGAMVTAHVGSGSVRVSGPLTAAVRTETGAGDIEVRGVSGPLSARTGTGSIQAAELSSASVQASSGAGRIALDLSGRAPEVVVAETGSGPVDLRLPPGRYRILANSGTGQVDVGVESHDGAAAVVTAKSGTGPVKVRPAAGAG